MQHRKRRLINHRIQLRMIATFTGLVLLALVLQATFLASQLLDLASVLPTGGNVLEANVPRFVGLVLATSLVVFLPLTAFVGLAVTFKVAGPLYRFEQWLGAIARGEDPGPCRIRRGDQLQELCTILNAAVDRLKDEQRAEDEAAEDERETRPAA